MFESSSDSPQLDRLAYKDEAKTRYRRPINETINELGEGRGMACSKLLAVKLANRGNQVSTDPDTKRDASNESKKDMVSRFKNHIIRISQPKAWPSSEDQALYETQVLSDKKLQCF
jgi:hypothetical protein